MDRTYKILNLFTYVLIYNIDFNLRVLNPCNLEGLIAITTIKQWFYENFDVAITP